MAIYKLSEFMITSKKCYYKRYNNIKQYARLIMLSPSPLDGEGRERSKKLVVMLALLIRIKIKDRFRDKMTSQIGLKITPRSSSL